MDAQARRFDPKVPFTLQQARAAGIGRDVLLGPDFHRLLHGLYVSADVPITLDLRARALLDLLDDDAHLSHHTAAGLWGLWVPDSPDLHLCRARGRRHSRPDVVTHTCRQHGDAREPGHITTRGGLQVSNPLRCFLELAPELSLVDLVVLGDSLVARRRASQQQLLERVHAESGPGIVRARRAAALVRAGVDSAMETRLRLLLVLAGLPEPQVNVVLRDESGEVRRRLDLAYPELCLAVEYDGRGHLASEEVWDADLFRGELTSGGWRSVVVVSRGIYREPHVTVERVERALRDAGWTGTRRPARDWTRHFPSR
ncbi:hypothetical protein [Barrientosiimonas humi]|uniref:hypothetical protein n=1 Tax=Barrientosiimonas humi TaxID=999931 RepID=UPI00370DD024